MEPDEVITVDFPFVNQLIRELFFHQKGTDVGEITRETKTRYPEPFKDLFFADALVHQQAAIHMENHFALFHLNKPMCLC